MFIIAQYCYHSSKCSRLIRRSSRTSSSSFWLAIILTKTLISHWLHHRISYHLKVVYCRRSCSETGAMTTSILTSAFISSLSRVRSLAPRIWQLKTTKMIEERWQEIHTSNCLWRRSCFRCLKITQFSIKILVSWSLRVGRAVIPVFGSGHPLFSISEHTKWEFEIVSQK